MRMKLPARLSRLAIVEMIDRRWLVGAMVVAMLGLVGCGGQDRLEVLRSDPMAEFELPDALDVRVTESQGSTEAGVSSPAKLRRTFTVSEGFVFEGVERLASAARVAGWDLRSRDGGGYEGEREIDELLVQILITGLDDDGVLWLEISTNDS